MKTTMKTLVVTTAIIGFAAVPTGYTKDSSDAEKMPAAETPKGMHPMQDTRKENQDGNDIMDMMQTIKEPHEGEEPDQG